MTPTGIADMRRSFVLAGLLAALAAAPAVARHSSEPAPDGGQTAAGASDAAVLQALQQLNEVPQNQVNEKTDPVLGILKALYTADGPDFMTLRKVIGKSDIRSTLNPTTRGVVANILSARWDTFSISGNLYLAALRSPNAEIRDKAQRKLVNFIQPAHIPALIDMLPAPGANVSAYAVLQEATGVHLDPNIKTWRAWWIRTRGKVDLTGHLLKDTRDQLLHHPVPALDEDKLWYVPDEVRDSRTAFNKRSKKEQDAIARWNDWAKTQVNGYADAWAAAKPVIERITHQPDPRVSAFLEKLVQAPGIGDYASVVLAWRGNRASLPALQAAYQQQPTVARALARGSLGDKAALRDLLAMIESHPAPLAFRIMDDDLRSSVQILHTVGAIPAEQAFELLAHRTFDFNDAPTKGAKKSALQKARKWLDKNDDRLSLDRRRGYFTVSEK
ncbi:MAG TPA: hypothetical protein VMU17_02215 [Elusimicrobiota bacterium]|nr:hypothetical protein [Elusimicrobiota bacterium]